MKSLLQDITLPFALIFLALSALFHWVAWRQDAHVSALTEDSVKTVAQVIEKQTHAASGSYKDGSEKTGPTDYSVHYEFTDPETGKTWQSKSSVGKEIWDGMSVGGHYEILLSRANPKIASLFQGEDFIAGATLARRLGQICAGLGLGGLALSFWLRKK
jgi:hypothetical protein